MPPSVPTHAFGGPSATSMIPILIAAVVIVLRNSRARKLKVERLWLFPVIYLAMLGLALYVAPPALTPLTFGLFAAALAVGVGLGWQRGRFIRIDVDPETHEMTAQPSVVGMLFILAVMLARSGMGYFLRGNPSALNVPATAAADSLIVLAVAMLTTQRVEIWIRATKLLEEARATKAALAAAPGAPTLPPGQPPLIQ